LFVRRGSAPLNKIGAELRRIVGARHVDPIADINERVLSLSA
jgi:hypothetical protein